MKTLYIILLAIAPALGFAQTTSDTKDVQSAKNYILLRGDTLQQVVRTITSAVTHIQTPTARAVYEFLNGFYIITATSATPDAARIKLANTNPNGVTLIGRNGLTVSRISGEDLTIGVKDTSLHTKKLAQSGATAGQILRWSGTEWVPSSANNPYVYVIANSSITAAVNTVLVGTLSANITLGLPSCNAGNDAKTFQFQKNGSDIFSVTIDPSGSEQFGDGALTKTIYSSGSGLLCTCRYASGVGSWFFTN